MSEFNLEVTTTQQNVNLQSVGLQGPVGPQGPQGSVGPQGPQGIQGPAGPLKARVGVASGASFTGTPRKLAIVFTTPFSDANFSVIITGVDSRLFTYESKTASGFTVNANSDEALASEVSWVAIPTGEVV